jgi:lipooligosaccharide transport system permease protein
VGPDYPAARVQDSVVPGAGAGAVDAGRPGAEVGTGWPPLRVLSTHLLAWKRLWRGSVFTSFLQPLLFFVAIGYGLGSLVSRGGRLVDGVPYESFVAPGMMAAAAMQTAIGWSTWPVLSAIKWQRQFHAMLATPIGVRDVVVGHLLHVGLRVLVSEGVFLAFAAAVGAVPSWTGILAVPVAVLVGLAFAAPVFAFTTHLNGDAGFNILFRLVMIPLFLFSGTFFPISQLPTLLEVIARITPLWHGVELARNCTLGRLGWGDLGHAAYLVGWVVAGMWLAVDGLRRRLVV